VIGSPCLGACTHCDPINVFRQVGDVGVFDLQTLLVNMVVATGLLSAATVLVDVCMLCPLRHTSDHEAEQL
jgi:hypothetical protein